MICIYACLSTRPEMWCEVAGIAYSVKSRKCHVRYNSHSYHLWDARSARSRLSRVRSAVVTWITRCCLLNLLTFDEFERVMRAVEKCVGNTVKRFEIMYLNWGPIYTLLVTRVVNMVYCISVLQKFNTFCSIQLWMLLIHRDRRGSAKRCAFARCVSFLLNKFPQKYFAI